MIIQCDSFIFKTDITQYAKVVAVYARGQKLGVFNISKDNAAELAILVAAMMEVVYGH